MALLHYCIIALLYFLLLLLLYYYYYYYFFTFVLCIKNSNGVVKVWGYEKRKTSLLI